MGGMSLGISMLLITMFLMYIFEILASYYGVPPSFMERCRTIITLMMLLELLYIILPSERISLLSK